MQGENKTWSDSQGCLQSVAWMTWHELKVILTYTTVTWTRCPEQYTVQGWSWQGLMVIHIPLCSELCARLCTRCKCDSGKAWWWFIYHCAVNYVQDCALCSKGCKCDSGKAWWWFIYHCAVNYVQDCALCSKGCKGDSSKAWWWFIYHCAVNYVQDCALCTVGSRVILARLDGDSYTTVPWTMCKTVHCAV